MLHSEYIRVAGFIIECIIQAGGDIKNPRKKKVFVLGQWCRPQQPSIERATSNNFTAKRSADLNPSISDKTPDRAESITTLVMVYKYGFADKPDILKGLSNS
ncbi:hypothetical protein C0J52_15397 [Blattella germanica]|nr:hypothetical protein C0J52_15397 [Blattella germanica]